MKLVTLIVNAELACGCIHSLLFIRHSSTYSAKLFPWSADAIRAVTEMVRYLSTSVIEVHTRFFFISKYGVLLFLSPILNLLKGISLEVSNYFYLLRIIVIKSASLQYIFCVGAIVQIINLLLVESIMLKKFMSSSNFYHDSYCFKYVSDFLVLKYLLLAKVVSTS